MTVELKSHVIRRDEKGLFGIPFKRLLAAAMTGGILLSVSQNTIGGAAGLALALGGGFGALVLTGSRGGIPVWRWLVYSARAWLLLTALDDQSWLRWLVRAANLSPDLMTLDGARLFKSKQVETVTRLTDWPLYRSPTEPEQAFALSDSPTAR